MHLLCVASFFSCTSAHAVLPMIQPPHMYCYFTMNFGITATETASTYFFTLIYRVIPLHCHWRWGSNLWHGEKNECPMQCGRKGTEVTLLPNKTQKKFNFHTHLRWESSLKSLPSLQLFPRHRLLILGRNSCWSETMWPWTLCYLTSSFFFFFFSALSDPAGPVWYFDPPLQRQCHSALCH